MANRIKDNGGVAAPKSRISTKKSERIEVKIPAIDVRLIKLKIKGDSPLVVHKWSEKAKEMIRSKTQGKAVNKKAPRKPKDEYEASRYRLVKGGDGIPCAAFKKCAANAFRMVDGLKKTEILASFHVMADAVTKDGVECVKITGKPRVREDMVRLQGIGRPADIRYRAEYPQWACTLTIRYNHNAITPSQIANLFNNSGFGIGICENRPEKGGSWGMFHVSG